MTGGADGRVVAVCTSAAKGTVKAAVPSARLREEFGLEGDAHAGPWHRQVSLLDAADVEVMRGKGLTLAPGAFGENVIVDGVDLAALGPGSLVELGPARLELTQVGKTCHARCAIYHRTGDCIMPRAGVFARVVRGGVVSEGDAVRVAHAVPRGRLQVAVVTVSDRCSRGEAVDTAGPALADAAARALDAHVGCATIVPDDVDVIVRTLEDLAARRVDLVLTAGGTGCAARDVTPEATRRVIEREVPGLAEAMRAASARVTPHALLQRGIAGLRGGTLIVNLPGSERAALENFSFIAAALPHAVRQLRGDTAHPATDARR